MKVVFKTNLDNYKTNCFPENLIYPPHKGDKVLVNEVFVKYFADKKLPLSLEVVDVIWTEVGVVCELWYSETDVRAAKEFGVNLF
mgnify:FL=1